MLQLPFKVSNFFKQILLLDNNQIKKIFLVILLCLFNSSANAGLKEIGNSYVSQETKDKINIQFEENKSKKKNKKFILYFRQMEMSIIFVIGDLPRKLQINFMEKFL